MKRIKSACLVQTVHFLLKDDLEHEAAVRAVQEDYAHYKKHLERTRTKYRIEEEIPQGDGSLVIRIRKQYNKYDCSDYIK